jgi:hypothetical protein
MDSTLVEMATQDMIDDHNKLVKQYYELLAKYDALLVMCVSKGIK